MRDFFSAALGKLVLAAAKLRGGGSALPGLVVERIDPGFMARGLDRLPHGVVAVSGTNGKTTTTKMIVEMLESQGLRVFTNRTGSNFSRGVVAAMVAESTASGKLDADIAVLELDEAHAMYFIDRVKPRITLLLNVLRDQLDRFGEVDTTAKYLQRIADETQGEVIINREDRLVSEIGARVRARVTASSGGPSVREFGLAPELLSMFPGDDDFHSEVMPKQYLGEADVTLVSLGEGSARFQIDGTAHDTPLQLEGLYNVFNAAAAIATVRAVCEGSAGNAAVTESVLASLANVRPAFGRGEKLSVYGQPLELVLVKNPSGFRLGLASFDAEGVEVMIAINDQYADGRDVSWLWDVDFRSLHSGGVHTVTGTRAWDMALRLEHDDVPYSSVEEDLGRALERFLNATRDQPKRIYCTYTAMLELRRKLGEVTTVEAI